MVRSTSVFRGFVFYYGAAVGDLLAVDAAARRLALAAADALAAARIPGGIVPHDDHDRATGDANLAETSIDAVGPTVGLLAHAGTVGGRTDLSELAVRHLRWHLAALVRDDGSVAHSATLNDDGVVVRTFTASQGLHAGSTWARAQAWGPAGGWARRALAAPRARGDRPRGQAGGGLVGGARPRGRDPPLWLCDRDRTARDRFGAPAARASDGGQPGRPAGRTRRFRRR